MKNWKRVLPPLVLLIVLMLRANVAREAAAQAIRQAAEVVFPALFPFCVVSRWLTQSGALQIRRGNRWSERWFGVPAVGLSAFVMGLCGGYPIGIHTACTLYRSGQLDRDTAQRLFRFCNNTGPAFFFGMVGAVLFEDAAPCAVLYGIHILSAVLTGLLVARPTEKTPCRSAVPVSAQPELLPETLRQSFICVAQLCGYVIFFSVLLRLALEPLGRGMGNTLPAIISALIDLPSGISAMARIGSPAVRFVLCSGGIAWGGLCVHMQAAGLWQAAGLTAPGYYFAKLLQTLLSLSLAIPAARVLLDAALPLWPVIIPFFALSIKKMLAFFQKVRYYKKKEQWRPHHAVSQRN